MVKTKFFKIACLMSAATMLATGVISGTMAKYASSGTVSGLTLTVASWNVLVAGETLSKTIDLGGVEWHIESIDSIPEPAANTAAPGTWGYAEISIVNESDVDAKITVSGLSSLIPPKQATISDIPDSLSFKVGVGESALSDFGSVETDIGSIETGVTLEKSGGTINIYVCYKWEFGDGENDVQDTQLGVDNEIFSFDSPLTITAEQAQGA